MVPFQLVAFDFMNREPRPFFRKFDFHNKEDPMKKRRKKKINKVFVSRGGIRL